MFDVECASGVCAMRTKAEQNIRLMEEFFQSLNDFDRLIAMYAPDVILNIFGRTPISGRWTDAKEFFAKAGSMVVGAFTERRLPTRSRVLFADDHWVCGMMEGDGVGKNGLNYDQQFTLIFRIEDGLIKESFEWFDTAHVEAVIFNNPLLHGDRPPRDRVDIGA